VPEEPIEAFLYPLEGDPESPGTIYFTGVEITIGRDPNFATVPIDDPSVDGFHARIIRQVDGSYHLRDQGSKAGTWIHYQEIPSAGQKLAHGDIVHFGRSGYRFAFSDPPAEKEIRITLDSDIENSTEDSAT
jgi:pSer/pThr/pTyr-binding forkhead associated (FHA) protein